MTKNKDKLSILVERYIKSNPSILEAMRAGLINYAALSRKICKKEKIENQITVSAACRRFSARVSRQKSRDEEINQIINSGKLLIRTNLVIAFLDHPRSYEKASELEKLVRSKKGTFNIIDGEESMSIITGIAFKNDIKKFFGKYIYEIIPDVAQLSFLFSKKATKTPGISSKLYSIISGAGINVFGELTSCGDHLLIIHEREITKALSLFKPDVSDV